MNQKHYETLRGEKIINKMIDEYSAKALKIISDIEYARGFGDLSENAEYKEAKAMQRQVSAILSELAEYKRNLLIVKSSDANKNIISICATIHLLDMDSNEKKIYRIVGKKEADASSGLLSYTSPIARAMMGKRIGDEFEFKAPDSTKVFYYKIEKFFYEDNEVENYRDIQEDKEVNLSIK